MKVINLLFTWIINCKLIFCLFCCCLFCLSPDECHGVWHMLKKQYVHALCMRQILFFSLYFKYLNNNNNIIWITWSFVLFRVSCWKDNESFQPKENFLPNKKNQIVVVEINQQTKWNYYYYYGLWLWSFNLRSIIHFDNSNKQTNK